MKPNKEKKNITRCFTRSAILLRSTAAGELGRYLLSAPPFITWNRNNFEVEPNIFFTYDAY